MEFFTLNAHAKNIHELAESIAQYAQDELERDMVLDKNTILNAMDAFEGGAHDGVDYQIIINQIGEV